MFFDTDEALIEEVRKRPLLYNRGHEDYKSFIKKDTAWKEISRIINLNDTKCRLRWIGLRNTYMRCKRMHNDNIRTVSGFPKPKWKYSKIMSFLDNLTNSKYTSRVLENTAPVLNTDSSEGSKLSMNAFEKVNDWKTKLNRINETAPPKIRERTIQDSTELLFASLALKINEANIPMNIVNQINAKVSEMVLSEIEYYTLL